MKTKSLCIPVLTLVAAGGYGVRQDAQKDALEQEVEALTARVEAIESYLQGHAKSMQALGSTLDEAEEKGFVKGINPESREALLAGWRRHIKTAGQAVPGPKEKAAEKADPRLRLRQEKD